MDAELHRIADALQAISSGLTMLASVIFMVGMLFWIRGRS